ncbi:Flavin-dependent oxidoreductase, luciferase family (Includes alkanesulfonate monooxygenase SsuD and methylene tetrahydromethanopterin reductase) (fragment) [Frankia canadensis]|uniref:Flavin-dependent oxidoreductase, luciferase family (Includes alkanesulfonate monooxygenase SsuD and methylene tetrahydromethanopterin reductase) n=2 Tax=Frankia canadensis TaxID=1836972 RepID=A0A2I2L0Q8_9ACTN
MTERTRHAEFATRGRCPPHTLPTDGKAARYTAAGSTSTPVVIAPMLNEHHATASCLNSAVPLHLAILARETSRARLLALGNPVGNRPDPVRVAEELALVDVLSLGRLQAGFVRGTPTEIHATNTNPTQQRGRFWEAIDLITKAWTSHDGPFSWEGEYFHHRQVNVWPRPYQQPHPPIWVTTLSASSAPELAARDYVMATIINGKEACRSIFDRYRRTAAELGRPGPVADRLAYCAYVFVGETHEEGLEQAKPQPLSPDVGPISP